MPADCIDFVDEDNAGSILLALLEQVADTAGAHADKHFYEIRTRNREEWYTRFAGNRPCQQRLTRSRRSDQQNAFGNTAAELLKLLRLAQELDNLLQLFLGFLHTRDVFERYFLLLRGMQPRPALAEAQSLISPALHLPHHKDPEGDQDDKRRSVQQDGDPASRAGILDFDVDVLFPEHFIKVRVVGRHDGVETRILVGVRSMNIVRGDGHVLNLTLLHFVQKL